MLYFFLDVDEIVMLELLGVVYNVVERFEVVGENVFVIGCGLVGLLVFMVVKVFGVNRFYFEILMYFCRNFIVLIF